MQPRSQNRMRTASRRSKATGAYLERTKGAQRSARRTNATATPVTASRLASRQLFPRRQGEDMTLPMGLLLAAPLASVAPSAEVAPLKDSPTPPPKLEWIEDGFYLNLGASPGASFRLDGFNPIIRYDAEIGMRWTRGRSSVSFGANPWVLQRLEAKGGTGGLLGVVSLRHRNIYARTGAGVLLGPPGSLDDRDVRSSVAGLVGLGLESRGEHVRGRFGFDYVASYDKAGRVNNTVFLVLALRFG